MADLALDGELRRSGASRSSGLLIVGALLGSAVSLAFNRLVAERLDDSTTNDIRAVLGGLSAIGFVSLGVQMAVIGVLGRGRDSHLTPSFERGGALVGAAFSVALGTGVATALVIESSSSFRLQSGFQVGLAVAAILVSCKPRAELLMNEQWGRLAILFVVGPSVRLAAAAWVLSESRPTFRLAPIVVAEVVTTILAFALRPKGVVGARTVPARQLLLGAVASAGLLAVLALSSFAVRARLGADADVFNSSATAARAVGFLPLTVSMIYFPRLARCAVGSRELRKAFVGATAWTVAIGGAAALALVVAPSLIVDFVAPSTHASESVVRLLSVGWAIHAVSLVALFVYIAHGSRFALAAWPIVVVIGLGQAAVGSAVQLGWLVLGSALLLAVAVTVPAFLRVQPILHARASTSRRVVRPGDVTLIVPCFNPGTAVVATIQQAAQVLTELSPNPAIIAVSDGSTDGSDDLIDQLDIMMLQHVRHETNRGKGAALRTGFARADTEFVAFIDADGDLAPRLLNELLGAQQELAADVVFGSKQHSASIVEASRLRRMYSSGYRWLIRTLFQLDIEDTQTGIKLYRREVLDAVLPSLQENKFALDLEIFVAARAAGFENFVAVPVVLRREAGSTISVGQVIRMFGDTLRLFWRTKVTLSYAKTAAGSGRLNDRLPA